MEKSSNTNTNNFWDYIGNAIEGALNTDRANIAGFINRYRGLIDFGIAPQQLNDIQGELPVVPENCLGVKISFVSDWLISIIETLTRVGEQKKILQEIKYLEGAIVQVNDRLRLKQEERYKTLAELIDFTSETGKQYKSLVMTLPRVDDIRYTAIYKNETAATGTFFDVDQRRLFASERLWVQKQDRRIEEMLKVLDDRNDRILARKQFDITENLLKDKLRIERAIDRLNKKLEELQEDIDAIPTEVITSSIKNNLERMKGIIITEVKKSGGESGIFRSANEEILDIHELYQIFRHIEEFNSSIFDNRITAQLGKPDVIFVPGKGSGLYDYRDNLFIIPLIPSYSLYRSVASAVISYALHNNDSGTILRDYGALFPSINSSDSNAVKQKLINSYTKWITTEYKGFKVLEKDERRWFLQKYTPPKDEFYIPLELQDGTFSIEERQSFIKNVRINVNSGKPAEENLWFISVLECQRGRYKKAIMYIKKLFKVTSDYIFAFYNLGMVYHKLGRRDEAIECFQTFVERNPQSWWARNAKDHVNEIEYQNRSEEDIEELT